MPTTGADHQAEVNRETKTAATTGIPNQGIHHRQETILRNQKSIPMDKWQLDQEGTIIGAGLHDGRLLGITLEGANVTLSYETWHGNPNRIVLRDATELNVGKFWVGNIIGQAWLWDNTSVQRSLWQSLFADRIVEARFEDSLNELIASAQHKRFFALECSYGAQVYALCDSIEII
jgi:hypothetical protein